MKNSFPTSGWPKVQPYSLPCSAGVNLQDQMGYADDLFILCYSLNNMRQVIKVLKACSAENNLGLNATKSGVMEFLPRKGRATMKLTIGEDFEGIPVVACYNTLVCG